MVGKTNPGKAVCSDKGVTEVLGLLHGLSGPHRCPLRENPRGEGDEFLSGAALEKADRGEIIACLKHKTKRIKLQKYSLSYFVGLLYMVHIQILIPVKEKFGLSQFLDF